MDKKTATKKIFPYDGNHDDLVQCWTCFGIKRGSELYMLHKRHELAGKYCCKIDCSKKKPGPKKGSAERTARLEIRCKPELLKLIDAIVNDSWSFADKKYSRADLIEDLIWKCAHQSFADPSEEVSDLIGALTDL